MDHDRRRDPRFKVRNGDSLEVTLIQGDARAAGRVQARLIDISRGGAQLSLAAPLQFNKDAVVEIKSASLGFDLSLAAGMCWARPEGDHGWLLGCAFDPRLPLEALDALLRSGVLDRRTSPRRTHRIPITARWELDPAPLPGYMWDVSEFGFCMLSPRRAGRQVTVAATGSTRGPAIAASAQWSLEVAGGYVVGCRLLHDSDQALLADMQTDCSSQGRLARRIQKVRRAVGNAVERCWRRRESY